MLRWAALCRRKRTGFPVLLISRTLSKGKTNRNLLWRFEFHNRVDFSYFLPLINLNFPPAAQDFLARFLVFENSLRLDSENRVRADEPKKRQAAPLWARAKAVLPGIFEFCGRRVKFTTRLMSLAWDGRAAVGAKINQWFIFAPVLSSDWRKLFSSACSLSSFCNGLKKQINEFGRKFSGLNLHQPQKFERRNFRIQKTEAAR